MSNAVPELNTWIEREFAGYGRALRRKEDTPLPDEPWMSMADAKELTRRAVAAFAQHPLVGVQREDVARAVYGILAENPDPDLVCTFDWDKGARSATYFKAVRIADAVLALPHTGQPQEGEEIAWVIERDSQDGLEYFTGSSTTALTWHNNHSRALRFARRQDAETFNKYWPIKHERGCVAEHVWLSASPASPRAEAGVTFCYVTYKACTASCPTREECALAPVAEKRRVK